MKLNIDFLKKRVLPVLIGLIGGYAYYYFIGCRSGSCPITSNPYVSVIYGGIMGLIFALPSNKKKEEQKNE
jgi:xanthine/uracil permease